MKRSSFYGLSFAEGGERFKIFPPQPEKKIHQKKLVLQLNYNSQS